MKNYARIIREGGLPKVKSEVQALADETNRSALEKVKEFYIKGMQDKTYATLDEVKKNHEELLPQAREKFLNAGTIDYGVSKRYLDTLEKEIDVFFNDFAEEKYEGFLADHHRKGLIILIISVASLLAALVPSPFEPLTVALEVAGGSCFAAFTGIQTTRPKPIHRTQPEEDPEKSP
uniref:Protein containing GBP C domain n=1 Tax=Rhipicephalus zambeziensis TaxID=60191 RepID=A0A224YPZ5_9ACAR